MSAGSSPSLEAGKPDPTDDQRACRWLLVGRDGVDPVERVIRDQLEGGAVTRVPDFLSALGEAAQAPVDVVVGPVEEVRGMTRPTAEALRQLAPQARLLLLADDAQDAEAESALNDGFDGWLPLMPTPEHLARALAGERSPRRLPTSTTVPHAARGERTASLRRRTEAAERAMDRFGRVIEPGDAAQAVAAPPQIPSEELGDVDLIESILGSGQQSARRLALEIVRARSAIAGVSLVSRLEELPAGHAGERVVYRGREFGYLCAPVEPDHGANLSGWAMWLAHWLAMDEQVRLLKDMSMRDPLTDVWNRRYFDRFLSRVLDWAGRERSQVTLLIFDIDDFKLYNDRYGHGAGDEILRETSKLMLSVVREHDVVARIGGDEFAVIFWDADPRKPRQSGSRHPEDVLAAATRFQQAICQHRFPKLSNEAPGTLTISGGLASFPWDGRTPEELVAQADRMALQSKRQGKNAIQFGPGAEQSLREPAE